LEQNGEEKISRVQFFLNVGGNESDCPCYKSVIGERTVEDCVDVVVCKVRVGKSAACTKGYTIQKYAYNGKYTSYSVNCKFQPRRGHEVSVRE
jgi:hypothetical protein